MRIIKLVTEQKMRKNEKPENKGRMRRGKKGERKAEEERT